MRGKQGWRACLVLQGQISHLISQNTAMKNTRNERKIITTSMPISENDVPSQLHLFSGVPSTLQSIHETSAKQKAGESIENFKESSIVSPDTENKSLQKSETSNVKIEYHSEDSEHGDSFDFSKTAGKLKSKKQNIRGRRMKHVKVVPEHTLEDFEITNQKILKICRNFMNKVKRNNVFSSISIQEKDLERYFYYEEVEGFSMSSEFTLFYRIYTTITIISLILSQTFLLVFPQLIEATLIQVILMMTAVSFVLQIIVNLVVVKRMDGKRISKLKVIAENYIKTGNFLIDFAILIMIILQLCLQEDIWIELLLVSLLLKVKNLMQKLTNLEQMVVKSHYYEKYWSLLKIIMFNFVFGHCIAVILNLMANMYPDKNWQTVKQIQNTQWFERYVWSYYWATTIMLTVGFGDITPTTYQQAIWIIFIQIISCIAFSYNISCLGNLIGNIRAQGEEIDKNRKIFQVMDKKIGFSEQLLDKVEHYINESVNIKSKFNISEEKTFIESLPESYKKEVKCETNKKLLKCLPFFSCLLNKTIYKLAEHMERHIYYPEEIIKPINYQFCIYVLESGKIGCICKKFSSSYNGIVANVIKIREKDQPFLMSQQFITLKKLNYEIKSLGYSVVHKLSYSHFLENLKLIRKDYEFYNFLRDKSKHVLDEYETINCNLCTTNHSYFDCPKYHYIPIRQNVLRKQLKKYALNKNKRQRVRRIDSPIYHALIQIKENEQSSKMIGNTDIASNFHKRLTQNQIQMRRFLVNVYNFDDINYFKTVENEEKKMLMSLKNKGEIGEWTQLEKEMNIFVWLWDSQIDMVMDYDIYFPQDNANKLSKKYKGTNRLKMKTNSNIKIPTVLNILEDKHSSLI